MFRIIMAIFVAHNNKKYKEMMDMMSLMVGLAIGLTIAYCLSRVLYERRLGEMNQRLAMLKNQLDTREKAAEEKIATEREYNKTLREELQKQMEARNKLMQEEMQNMASRMLEESREKLTTSDKERLNSLLNPLKERLETFSKAVEDNSKENAGNKREMRTVFEETLKRMRMEQENTVKLMRDDHERAVKDLKEQTEKIGRDAASLTNALKGNTKTQGDWGELILEKTLEDCGLVKDEQYFLQENYKDEEGNNLRPDAVIKFPNEERVVIDAKVSLTAYQEALRTEEKTEREKLLRAHVASMKKHVDELSAKNYEKLVPGCIGYVLMFVPYESGFSAAVKTDVGILQYAYRKHIIILSPSNLLMALQLTHTLWQNYRLNKNVEEILRQSNDLYDKFVTFGETFVKLGTSIQRLQTDYDKAHAQLSEGKGNIVRRLEGMKQLGITPKKQLPDKLG